MSDDFVFPQGIADLDGKEMRRAGGLTKRELFAAMLMGNIFHLPAGRVSETVGLHADIAVEAADALLAALEKPRA